MAAKRVVTVTEKALIDVINQQAARIDELIADVGSLDTALDALATKLNSDGGVTDTDYAGAGTMTSDGESADTLVR